MYVLGFGDDLEAIETFYIAMLLGSFSSFKASSFSWPPSIVIPFYCLIFFLIIAKDSLMCPAKIWIICSSSHPEPQKDQQRLLMATTPFLQFCQGEEAVWRIFFFAIAITLSPLKLLLLLLLAVDTFLFKDNWRFLSRGIMWPDLSFRQGMKGNREERD